MWVRVQFFSSEPSLQWTMPRKCNKNIFFTICAQLTSTSSNQTHNISFRAYKFLKFMLHLSLQHSIVIKTKLGSQLTVADMVVGPAFVVAVEFVFFAFCVVAIFFVDSVSTITNAIALFRFRNALI